MENRYSVRLPLRLTVEVIKDERFLGRFVTRDIDIEGVFIEMRTTDLEENDVVELTFIVPDDELSEYTVMAGVVRLSTDGAGMMLFGHEHRVLDVLAAAELAGCSTGFRARPTFRSCGG